MRWKDIKIVICLMQELDMPRPHPKGLDTCMNNR